MKKPSKNSIRAQIFFAFLGVVVVISAVFSPYGFYTNVHSIRSSLDERLRVAATGVLEILPERYHERLLDGDISEAEYRTLQTKLIDYAERAEISYLYCVVRAPDGKYYFSLSQDAPPFVQCGEESVKLPEIYENRKMLVTQGRDEDYGIVSRTVMLPVELPDGRMFVIGADLNVDVFRPMVIESITSFLIIMLSGLILVLLMTLFVSKRLSYPIQALTRFAKRLADSGFSSELKLSDELPESEISTREVAVLAENIELMRKRLSDYLNKMEVEALARQKIETELKLAGRLQLSFLPGTGFESADIKISAFMKTARESGGDLYDFFTLPSGLICFTIGDVAGKGITAALFMARTMSLIRSGANIFTDLNTTVRFINRVLCEANEESMFLTFFIATYNPATHEIKFINCGHNPPYLMKRDGGVEMMKIKPNCVLGIFEDAEFESESFTLSEGETFVCYTDGVTEAVSASSDFYGDARLEELLKSINGSRDGQAVISSIVTDVDGFSKDCEQADDITLLVLQRKKG